MVLLGLGWNGWTICHRRGYEKTIGGKQSDGIAESPSYQLGLPPLEKIGLMYSVVSSGNRGQATISQPYCTLLYLSSSVSASDRFLHAGDNRFV